MSLKFTNNMKYIISASDDKTIKIWELQKCNLIRTLYGHKSEITSIDITKDDQQIASGSRD